jgi:hypothetical protein
MSEIPDLLVERLALGELDEARAASLRLALERERAETGRDRLAEIRASNAEILAEHPPAQVAAQIRARAHARRPTRLWMMAPVLTAAVVLLWVVTRDAEPTTIASLTTGDDDREDTRIKGGVEPHLVIDRKLDAGHERLTSGEQARAGDLLQLSYVPAGRRAGVIVSIDGAGIVTLHHPNSAAEAPMFSVGLEIPLAHAYELDDAPGFERFILVTRDDDGPIEVAQVLAAAEQLASNPSEARSAPLELGAGWTQHSIVLRKSAGQGDP